jgi:hypothetical protein
MYNAPSKDVMDMRCGNCAAFVQTPKMMECIKSGLEKANESPKELSYDQQFIDAANLGYCELFHFTCAAKRTCDAWKSGAQLLRIKYGNG